MGFIEDLRRQREREVEANRQLALRKKAKEEQRKALLAQAEEKKKKIETEESKRYAREIEQAKGYFAKSDFARLSKELASVVGGITLSSYSHYGGDKPNQSAQFGIELEWNERKENRRKKNYPNPLYSYYAWDEVYEFIIIGCDKSGTITLSKSWGDIKLPMSKWLGNPTVQEEALGRAYRNPKHNSTEHDDRVDRSVSSWDRFGVPPGTPR